MLKAVDPNTGQLIHEYEPAGTQEIDGIIAKAAASFDQWKRQSFGERAAVLNEAASYMRTNAEKLARPMTREMGKPVKEALGEVNKAAWCAEHYAQYAEEYLARETIESDAALSYVIYQPLGPILGVLPWNAPFWLAFRFCAPTLMAGNTCLMKHDSHVPQCARAIAGVFDAVGAPPGIMQNLPVKSAQVEAVIRDPRVRGVSLTGSTAAGSAVASIAASEIKPALLELGGSDPSIVLADADLPKAADLITTMRIINAGQSCIAAKRVIVERQVYDVMVDLLAERLKALKVGDPADMETDIGPIARGDLRDDLHRQVKETVHAGARCLLGGSIPDGPGYFYPVTLLADVDPSMVAACEETFGPVMVVMAAEDADQALKMANDTPYGLAASVWTDSQRGESIAWELEAGQVAVNGLVKTDPRLPSGGVKKSGYGRELGPHGIREFVNAKQIWIGPAKT